MNKPRNHIRGIVDRTIEVQFYNNVLMGCQVGQILSDFNILDGTSLDMTDIHNTRTALKTTLKQLSDFKFALDVSSLVTIADADGTIEYVNDKFCLNSKYSREELIGKNHRILSSGHHSKEFFRDMWRTIQQGEVWRNDILNRAKDGTLHWFDTIIVPFMNEDGKPYQYAAIRTDSTHRKRSEEQITYMAYHDALTGLPNRRLFMKQLEESITPAAIDQKKTAVILMDLDNFKFINDSLGHQVGDSLLQSFAIRINKKIRSEDTLARLGGDEFILLFPDAYSQESISQKCQMLIDSLQEPFCFNNKEYHIGVSIGVSLYPDHGEDANEIVKNADIAMYKAKEKGKNSFYIYKSSLNEQVKERLDFEMLLRKALDNDEFVLHYQPKINLKMGTMYGIEALIRWQSPELGLVPPLKFIPFAEQNGLIEPIYRWVLRKACLQNKEWQGKGFPPVVMSINISPRQFQQENIVKSVTSIIQQTGLNPKWVELEITESGLMVNPQECVNKLQALKDFGISLSIDDFGTGFSSLSYLKVFPVDYLKIDRCFINEIQTNSKDRAITRSIITLARNLGIAVVAEGIEDEEHIKVLQEENCDYGQGYYWGYPQDAGAIVAHWTSTASAAIKN
ncbi:MAG: EAL domain-containing protein [Paenibacillaceae bacterium]